MHTVRQRDTGTLLCPLKSALHVYRHILGTSQNVFYGSIIRAERINSIYGRHTMHVLAAQASQIESAPLAICAFPSDYSLNALVPVLIRYSLLYDALPCVLCSPVVVVDAPPLRFVRHRANSFRRQSVRAARVTVQ